MMNINHKTTEQLIIPMKSKLIKTFFLAIVLASTSLPLFASSLQLPDDTPIDGGIVSVTLIAAAYIAMRKRANKDAGEN